MARILVVDDIRFISKILASFFEDRGHDVQVAADGEKALEYARQYLPELILTDISMPQLDGLEVARRLKSDSRTAFIPIMVVTARNDSDALIEAKEAGVDEFVLKPFDAQRLLRKATALLGGFPMDYALTTYGKIPVLAALAPELAGEAVRYLRDALAAAQGEAVRCLVIDLSRVKKVDVSSVGQVLAVLNDARRQHVRLHVIPPTQGMGVRSLVERLTGLVDLHRDLPQALVALQERPDALPRPVRLGAPAPGTKVPTG